MIRLIGCALVLLATTGIGFGIASQYRDRTHMLRGLIEALRLLQSEVEYRATPLPEALRQVGTRLRGSATVLCNAISDALSNPDVTVSDALRTGVQAMDRRSVLKPADVEAMTAFGRTLGLSDSVHQSQQFGATLAQLESLEREATEAQKKYERMWQYIGVLAGLFIVLLVY